MEKIKPIYLVVVLILLSACRFLTYSISDFLPEPDRIVESQAEDLIIPEVVLQPGNNPLTGLPPSDPALLDRRPVMIKVSNWPRNGRPHSGLNQADIVFEHYIGFEMNRFLAVYYGDNSEKVGPLRSGRLVDAQLATLYQGLFAYGNADPKVEKVLLAEVGEGALAWKRMPCPPVCGKTRDTVSGMFVDSGAVTEFAISKGVDNAPPELNSMLFSQTPPMGDSSGALVHVEYAIDSIMEWHYVPSSGSYHLWTDTNFKQPTTAPMIDRNNGQEIIFENLVVMYAEYVEYAPLLHDIFIQDIVDPQPAFLFRDGVMVNAAWHVEEPDRPIVFETLEGEPLAFKPGRTWFVIVGLNSEMEEIQEGSWWINFELP